MGIIKNKRKFKRTEEGSNLTNPTKNKDLRSKEVNLDPKTILEQKEN